MTPPADDRIAPPKRGAAGLPRLAEEESASSADSADELRSLRDDVEALIEDGRTYLETELAYQQTRAAFVADRAKDAVIYGTLAAALGVLALIGLTVGLIIALTPLLTAWGASAAVVGALLLGAAVFARLASSRWKRLMQAIEAAPERKP